MDFASSGYARDFFQGQVSQIVRALKQIADGQEKLIELQKQGAKNDKMPVKTDKKQQASFMCAMRKIQRSSIMIQEILTICS